MRVWPEVELGDVCEFKYGKSLAAGERDGGAVPVYGSNGVVGHHSVALTAGPSIIVGRKGSFGEVNYSPSACWPIDTTYYVDQTATGADLRWLSYRLACLGLTGLNRAAAIPGLNREDAYRQRLLLPPIDEQRRIAAILDQADALRNARREALDLLAGLAPALFEDLFRPIPRGSTTFGDLAEVQGGLQVTSARSKLPQSAPYLRVANVHRNQLDLSVVKDIQVTPVELARTGLLEGDLLFVEGHANPLEVGRVAMWDGSIPGCTHQNHLIRGRLDTSRCHPVFATYWLNSPRGAAHFRREGKTTSGLNTISASTVRSAPMLLPPIELQQEFATKVGEISAQREAAQRSLATLEDLLRSTQAKAFSGQL